VNATAAAQDEDRTGSPVRAIVRCETKGCRTPYTVAFETHIITWAHNGRMAQRREVTYGGRTWQYRDRNDLAQGIVGQFTCTGCNGHRWSWAVIEGHFTESVKCGARCRNAVGASCDCQCGGENHAIGHVAL
jgi:hypothetical protein